jgi:regulator of sirC expression with transglutaminase-like and TPR domain
MWWFRPHHPDRACAGPVFATAAAVFLGLGCRGPDRGPGPIASALLAVAAESSLAPADVAGAWPILKEVARRVRAHAKPGRDPAIDDLNAVIFGELGFAREIERDDLDVMALPSVLANRKGSCVGLGALYLAVGEWLGIPLVGVLVPGHFFVRTTGAHPRNVELLRRGEALADAWYIEKYGPWATPSPEYLRALTVFEVVGVHWFNVGNELGRRGDLTGAARAYALAVKNFPAFAEAAASLGAVLQLQGDLPAARNAYRDAARARSDLPGLAQNLSVLDAQQENHPKHSWQDPREQREPRARHNERERNEREQTSGSFPRR